MSIFNVNTSYISEKLIPPSIRGLVHLAWLRIILKPIQSLSEYIFTDYKLGAGYPLYDVTVAYSKLDRVVYSDRRVYLCIADTTSGILPTDTNYWVLINENFVGADERAHYNSQKMLFEYALNKWFQVSILDPQIYITNNAIISNDFVMDSNSLYSSTMDSDSKQMLEFMDDSYTVTGLYDFTIFVPIAVYNAQGSTNPNRDKAIRSFADKLNLIGILYDIQTF